MNWVLEEAKKCDPQKDRVILENPERVRELDALLVNEYYPFIKNELEKTEYRYSSIENGINIQSEIPL